MKKDLQRLVLASIIGSLAVMTGCGQKNNNGMMKGPAKPKAEDHAKSWYDDDKDSDKDDDQKKDHSSADGQYNSCE